MPSRAWFLALMLVAPQSGWVLTHANPREVGRVYWELIPQTEVWVRLIPEMPDGKPPLVNLVFHAFYPGRAERDPYTGLPQWPKGPPARLTVSAEPLPLTVIRELSLQVGIDGNVIDLTGTDAHYRIIPCVAPDSDCSPNAVEAEVDASLVRSIVTARSVAGVALGFPFRLVADDRRAVGDFVARVGLAEDLAPKK